MFLYYTFGTLFLACASHHTYSDLYFWLCLWYMEYSFFSVRFFGSFSFAHFHFGLCKQPFWIDILVILKFAQHRMLKNLANAWLWIYFIFYFHLRKSCNFDYSDLLPLINNSVGINHCNHQPCSYKDWRYICSLQI